MKVALFKQKKTTNSTLSTFKVKAEVEQNALDTLISGLMGNCHDEPSPLPVSSSATVLVCGECLETIL